MTWRRERVNPTRYTMSKCFVVRGEVLFGQVNPNRGTMRGPYCTPLFCAGYVSVGCGSIPCCCCRYGYVSSPRHLPHASRPVPAAAVPVPFAAAAWVACIAIARRRLRQHRAGRGVAAPFRAHRAEATCSEPLAQSSCGVGMEPVCGSPKLRARSGHSGSGSSAISLLVMAAPQ